MNSTLVETYQRTHGERSTFMEHFRAIFGRQWWVWPWPIPSAPPPDYSELAIADDVDMMQGSIDHAETDSHLGIAGEESEAAIDPKDVRGESQSSLRSRHRPDGSVSQDYAE